MFKNCYITDVDLSYALHAKYIYFSKLNTSLENIQNIYFALRMLDTYLFI